MFVKTLDLKNFRNYESLALSPDPGTNIFYGENAQGKTNILEAIYLAGTSRSHRPSRDKDMIRMGEEESHIRLTLDRQSNDYRIDVHLRRHKSKGIAVNGLPVKRAGDLLELTSIVFFSPEDLNIIKNGPAERRKFLDSVLCSIDRVYLSDLTNYNKCLTQRSALLKEIGNRRASISELDVWDLQLVQFGSRIVTRRKQFLEELNQYTAKIHSQLTGEKENLICSYEANCPVEELEERIVEVRSRDLKLRTNSIGPHRDDIVISANDFDLRTYGSQGQQRTAALSLKLAEIQVYEADRGTKPILLLDDVLSELDHNRQNYLLKSIRNTQTFITCTGLDDFVQNHFEADQTFHVVRGGIV